MQKRIAEVLLHLNQEFYDAFAEAFSDSRTESEPGMDRVLAQVGSGESVLDLGCGQGRLANLLPPACRYVGIDYSTEMLKIAKARAEDSDCSRVRFLAADLVNDPWSERLDDTFDWVFLRAVLHHIPGHHYRQDLVRRAAVVVKPGGHLVLANWQFLKIDRLRRRILPWRVIGLDASDVEDNDYLLDWRRQGRGFRYVHLVNDAETRTLASAAGLTINQTFLADGHTNDLTLYAVLVKPDTA